MTLKGTLSDGGLEVLAFPVGFFFSFSPGSAGWGRNEKEGGHSEPQGDELIVISCDKLQHLFPEFESFVVSIHF